MILAIDDGRDIDALDRLIPALPTLDISEGYFERAGRTRRRVLAEARGAPLADALIYQSCLDHDARLITRDRDFAPFAKYCGMNLY
ncbi:MAG TPA: PIN domain-containing protein [Rhodospirillales bacterium]|nr:PIN domain-containing protein [Rhodospirillales bacterium]